MRLRHPLYIWVVGYHGRLVVVVSCVSKDQPYRAHPHCLVGENCRDGIFQAQMVPNDDMVVPFPKISVQCTKKNNVKDILKLRQEKNIDPFQAGFDHLKEAESIDLHTLRLCFQVMIWDGPQGKKAWVPLQPVVSEPIINSKISSSLKICKLSHGCASVDGDQEIMLFCEPVTKTDIRVVFYEESGNERIWEEMGQFEITDVHRSCGISLRTPKYRTFGVTEPVAVFIQLWQPSTNKVGEALPFQLIPREPCPVQKRKRQSCADRLDFKILCQLNPSKNPDSTFALSPSLEINYDITPDSGSQPSQMDTDSDSSCIPARAEISQKSGTLHFVCTEPQQSYNVSMDHQDQSCRPSSPSVFLDEFLIFPSVSSKSSDFSARQSSSVVPSSQQVHPDSTEARITLESISMQSPKFSSFYQDCFSQTPQVNDDANSSCDSHPLVPNVMTEAIKVSLDAGIDNQLHACPLESELNTGELFTECDEKISAMFDDGQLSGLLHSLNVSE